MKDIDPTFAADEFLAHSAWVRRLARRLLDDEADVDDLAQEAWMILQRQPAGRIRDLQAWLGGVVHRIARRTRHQRAARSAIGPGRHEEPLAPSTEHVLEVEATRRLVVDAVLSLDEPYRSALLLHFYEGLAPRDIAARLGQPGSTVRTRIQRGLARVREKLGARDPREGRAARASLMLLAEGMRPPVAPIGKGLMLAGSTSKIALVGFALVLLGIGLWWLAPDGASVTAFQSASTAATEPGPLGGEPRPAVAGADLALADSSRAGVESPAPTSDGRWHLSLERSRGTLRGTVVDGDDNVPVAGVQVRITTDTGAVAHDALLADEREAVELVEATESNGAFAFDDLITGAYRLHAVGAGESEAEESVTVTEDGPPVLLILKDIGSLTSRIDGLSVRSVDERQKPLPGVEIELTYRDRRGVDHRRVLVSDERGAATCDGLDLRIGMLTAATRDGRTAREQIRASYVAHHNWLRGRRPDDAARFPYEVVLRPGGSIAGAVRGAEPPTVVHAWLRAGGVREPGWPLRDSAACAADGTFTIPGLTAGTYVITVDAPPGLRADLPFPVYHRNVRDEHYFPRVVRVDADKVTPVHFSLVPGPVVQGRVVDERTDRPVVDARVRAWVVHPGSPDPGGTKRGGAYTWSLASTTSFDEWTPTERVEVRTDAAGRYRLSGLDPSRPWVLEVLHPGLAREFVDPLAIEDGETLELVHRLGAGAGIQGIAWRHASILVERETDGHVVDSVGLQASERSTFTVTGLAPGRYRICARHWLEMEWRVPLTVVDVHAGQLTWVDLRASAPYASEARLLLHGLPVAGATLDLVEPADQRLRAITAADGRLSVRFPFASSDPATLETLAMPIADAVKLRIILPGFLEAGAAGIRDIDLPDGEIEVEVVDAQGQAMQATVVLDPLDDSILQSKLTGFLNRQAKTIRSELPAPETEVVFKTKTSRRPTDASGRSRFRLVPRGLVQVSAESRLGQVIGPVSVEVPAQGRSSVVLRAPETGSVRVQVVDRSGQPIASARVRVLLERDEREFALATPGMTDERGEVSFRAVAVGRAKLVATTQGEDVFLWRTTYGGVDVTPAAEAQVTLTIE